MSRYQTVKAYIRQWIRVAGGYRWIRAAGGYILRWTEPAVLATLAVAVLALIIQIELANQAKKRAAVSRSVALYQDFVGSTAVRKLRETQYKIEHLTWKYKKGKFEDRVVSVFKKPGIVKNKVIIRQSLVGTFQRIKLIYNCGNFQEIYENVSEDQKTGEYVCDRSTISTLLGGNFVELFYAFRPVFYCDKFFKENYYQEGEFSGYVGMWESLVMDHLQRDMFGEISGEKFGTFRDVGERAKAIKAGQFSESSKFFTVMRLTPQRCKFYPKR